MSPAHDFNNIGDVLDFDLLKGTIVSLDFTTDTCTVTVGDVTLTALLFYHCEPDSVLRDNGAIEGAAAGFSEGDKVVVLKKYDNTVVKVIAHVDGIRSCGIGVELISAGLSYWGRYVLGAEEIASLDELTLYEQPYNKWTQYFSFNPNYPYRDITEESCVCVVPGRTANTLALVAADNHYVAAINHKDDWHNIQFKWIGYPYWFAAGTVEVTHDTPWEGGTLKHPGLLAIVGNRYYHLSHSQLTWGNQYRSHWIRHIDQEKRLYRPGRIDLKYDDVVVDGKTTPVLNEDGTQKYLMTNTGEMSTDPVTYKMSVYGKKPFTRDATTELIKSYNERVEVGAGQTYTINGEGIYTYNMVFFFWPFIPYLWEIPNFDFFNYASNDSVYGRCFTPESGAGFKGWAFHCTDIDGTEQTSPMFADSAVFVGRPNANSHSAAIRPHIEGVWPDIHLVGSYNATLTDTDSNSWGYTAAVTKTVPIGTVCNGKCLSVSNSLSITGEHADSQVDTHSKATTIPDGAYWWYPSELGWWQIGTYQDHSTINSVLNETLVVSGTHTSTLQFGPTVIESGNGTMTYNYSRTKTIDVDNLVVITIFNEGIGLPWFPNKSHASGSGSRIDSSSGTGTMTRNIICFSVLDYDSESIFKYENSNVAAVAVVYKKITISNTIERTKTANSTIDTKGYPQSAIGGQGDGLNGWPRNPTEDLGDVITETDNTVITGTRTIEYKIYVKVGENTYTKTLETLTIDAEAVVTGRRIYGVVCKLQAGYLVVSYDVDEFVTTANANIYQGGYDSPLNFEDWNSCLGTNIWNTVKRVVGVVYLGKEDRFGWDLYDEQEPIPDEIYSVSIKDRANV